MKHIFTQMALLTAKIASFASTTCHCLVRVFGWKHIWTILMWKWSSWSSNDWCSISRHDNTVLSAEIGWYWCGQYLVSTRQSTYYTPRETIQLLHQTFPGCVLSRDHNWQSRSCDLTPLDFFSWSYLKSQPTSIQQPVHQRRRFNAAPTKFSHINTK